MASRREKKVEEMSELLLDAQISAANYIRDIQAGKVDSGVRWADREVATQINRDLALSSLAAERTKTMADSHRQLGLVVIPATIAGKEAWEKYALEARKTETKYIDVEAKPVDGK